MSEDARKGKASDPELEEELEDDDDAGEEEGEGGLWPADRLVPVVEALVFASGDPLPAKKIAEIVEGSTRSEVKAALKELADDFRSRGLRLVEVAGGWQLRTAPEHYRFVRKLFHERPYRLTRAAVETMAIVAYNQPVTRGDVEQIRGVDCGGVLESMVERRLLRIVGRRDVPGRPLLYATTKEFLELFGLKNLRDLPTLAELGDDIERMAGDTGFHSMKGGDQGVLPLEDGDDDAATQTGQADPAEGGEESLEEEDFGEDDVTGDGAGEGLDADDEDGEDGDDVTDEEDDDLEDEDDDSDDEEDDDADDEEEDDEDDERG